MAKPKYFFPNGSPDKIYPAVVANFFIVGCILHAHNHIDWNVLFVSLYSRLPHIMIQIAYNSEISAVGFEYNLLK